MSKEHGAVIAKMGSAPPRDPYYFVRFRWSAVDLNEWRIKFKSEGFGVELHEMPKGGVEIGLNRDWNRDHLIVKADTLEANLAGSVATLLQHSYAPFTKRDVELRKQVFELYNHDRPTALPFYVSPEPKFETE